MRRSCLSNSTLHFSKSVNLLICRVCISSALHERDRSKTSLARSPWISGHSLELRRSPKTKTSWPISYVYRICSQWKVYALT